MAKEIIPTAEEFYLNPNSYITKMMKEFAKLHCEAQAKEIDKIVKSSIITYNDLERHPNLILNAYPLTNIK